MQICNAANNVAGLSLAQPHAIGSSSFVIASGAELLPSAPFRITVVTAATYMTSAESLAIYKVTGVSANTLTVSGPIEGTSDQAFAIGDKVDVRLTAGAINDLNAVASVSMLTANPETAAPGSRRLVAGTGITFNDGGAGGPFTINSSAGGFTPQVAIYKTPGAFTYTVPNGSNIIRIQLIAGGGGGGAGVVYAGSSIAQGGAGGGGGAMCEATVRASDLIAENGANGANVQVVVGGGGTGGASAGANGGYGGATTFGDFMSTAGGSAGFGGAISAGPVATAPGTPGMWSGCGGSSGSGIATAMGGAGGGVGGSYDGTTASAGASSSKVFNLMPYSATWSAGGAAGAAGAPGRCAFGAAPGLAIFCGGGGGGGGGAGGAGQNGGAGGAGGGYGGGGGGGGSCAAGQTPGAGGAGSPGLAIVYAF